MPISLSGSLNLSGSLTTTGTITATTLVVQTITSSISSITGSTKFGSLSSDTHKFTGSLNVTGSSTFTAGVTPLTVKGTNAGTMYTEYYYNTSTLVGSIGNGSGLLSGANASDFIIRSEADYVVATGGNNRRMTISSAETTLNFNPQSGSLLSGYNYLNFGGGSIMYRNMTDLYIGSNAKYGSAGTTVACYTSANGMGMLTMDGGSLNYQATTGSVTANTAYGMPIRFTITSGGNVGIGTSSPNGPLDVVGPLYGGLYTLSLYDSAAVAADIGGGIYFGGNYTGTTKTGWAGILGRKENATDGQYGGYMAFQTRTNGFAPAERMRVRSDGTVLIGKTTTGMSSNGTQLVSNGEIYISITNTANTLHVYDTTNSAYRFYVGCLLYTSPSPRDRQKSRMPSSA